MLTGYIKPGNASEQQAMYTKESMEGYQCQKSTLCNKRSNKKECGILQALA